MDGLRAYVLCVAAASMLCGVLIRLPRSSGSAEIIRMLCGIFLTIVLIQPLAGKKTRLWEAALPDVGEEAEEIISEGRASAEDIRKDAVDGEEHGGELPHSRGDVLVGDVECAVGEPSDNECLRNRGR